MTAAIVTITEETLGGVRKILFAITTDSSAGTATATTTSKYTGVINRVVVDPGSGGTVFTTGFSVTLKDEDGYDLLNAQGASLVNTAVTQKGSGDITGTLNNDKIALAVSAAGNSKVGNVVVYVVDISHP